MTAQVTLPRRRFVLGSLAGGLSLGFSLPTPGQAAPAIPAAGIPIEEVNAWVVVRPDETVVVRIARSEMGQGTLTGLAQLVAEELECDWDRVTTEYPGPAENLRRNRVWGSFATGGSRGIRESEKLVREGGATARHMLVAAAAAQWQVPAGECRVEKGRISHPASGRSTSYGQVASAAASMAPPSQIVLKDPKDWKIAGQSLKRLDTADKLTGRQLYGADLTFPGMLNAAVKSCQYSGGRIASYDEAAVAGMPGVRRVVRIDDATVAVVATTWWQAKTALDAMPITWDEGPHKDLSSATINAMLAEGLEAEQAFVGHRQGDAKGVLGKATRTITATYGYPFQNHATMEPMNATALFTGDRCEVWAPTQNGEASLAMAAEAAGLPPAQCEVHKLLLGGGFGRRGFQDFVRQVVILAKAFPGTHVKLLWTREEDMLHGYYHPTTQAKLTGALDAEGNLTALHLRISGQSILASVRPEVLQGGGGDPIVFQGLTEKSPEGMLGYSIPNILIDHAMRNPPIRPGFWRGVNLNQNALYIECFLDELAHEAGIDPLEFRRKLMRNHPRHLAVLDAVAERIGWDTPPAPGIGRGLAQIMGFGAYVAAAAEVSVEGGSLKVHRIVAATDPGHVVNPAQVERQVEGSFVYGLSAGLLAECTVANGRIEQENFDTYEPLRLAQMPKVETIMLPSGGFWGGVGEPTIAVATPAVLNGLFAATGRRVRMLPLKNHSLS